MDLTLLLDLDNTLLDSSMDTFLPAYFQSLSGFLKEQVDPELMIPALISGTRKMVANNNPTQTLKQVFDAHFFPEIGYSREELQPRIDLFYEEVFPTLSYLTKPRPEALELVEWAVGQGIRMAIATNPLFPLRAIHHRMRWAGLQMEESPFVIVSAYESFHFAKPHPAYFAEILGRMGWPDGPVLMVGDNPVNDLTGSHGLGLSTYWIDGSDAPAPDGINIAGRGPIGDLHPWLEQIDLSTLEPDFSGPEALIALMLSTPAILYGILPWLSNLGQAAGPDMKRRPVPREWSVTEVLCHLRDTEQEINLPRLRMLLELEEPFIPASDTDVWAVTRDYKSQDASLALSDFARARMQNVTLLRSLTNEWKRKARHAIFGPTDLQELVRFIAEHDKLHIRQILTTLEQLGD